MGRHGVTGNGAGQSGSGSSLLKDLQRRVKLLEADLRERAEQEPEFRKRFKSEYAAARDAERTATTYAEWLDGQVTQSAVAWVLSCVFLRFSEDNALIKWPYLSGPGERLSLAQERQDEFFRVNPHCNDRDWILEGFAALKAAAPAARGLFDEQHNPLWRLAPSYTAASELLAYWRQRDELGLEIRHSFYDAELKTRFLGDLYQDLSETARKTYALLQTPDFVEEFILDLTLTPALKEFGLTTEFKLIDPTCGSGHFLLGAFDRLLAAWRASSPGEDDSELITRSLRAVNGVDKNPFAAAIARFRLLIAAMQAANKRSFAEIEQYDLPIRVAVADSLWHGAKLGRQGKTREKADSGQQQLPITEQNDSEDRPFTYAHEDVYESRYSEILKLNSYHVVVGNPPYITVKDKAENQAYRESFDACSGQYALSVPFAQLFFWLAVLPIDGGTLRRGGFVGQITANSFMKREFGKKLIQDFFALKVDLTHIIDTSGAYIPGHGTPTVILVGRQRIASTTGVIRAVLGVRGEPAQPKVPRDGLVWTAITKQTGEPGSNSEWVTVEDADRDRFTPHPWSLGGGGASEVLRAIEGQNHILASKIAPPIGRAIRAGADEAYMRTIDARNRPTVAKSEALKALVIGEHVRDWNISCDDLIWYPYAESDVVRVKQELWAWRTLLAARRTFQGDMNDAGLGWWDYMQHTASAYITRLSIAFAEVATHNNFALDRGGRVFKQTAPVIKLPTCASEDDYLAILGALNSSVACFWMKQVSQAKAGGGTGRGMQDEAWEERYQFSGTKLEQLPVPDRLPLQVSRTLDSIAQQLATQEPSALSERQVPTRVALDSARTQHDSLRGRMVAWQEELDWESYRLYGLLTDEEAASVIASRADLPDLQLGERAFEIVLARSKAETQWFVRHGSSSIIDIPAHWPVSYRQIVQARIALIAKRPDLALIERPECKRRWASESWETKERSALRTWLLDRCEDRSHWFVTTDGMTLPRALTINQLADLLNADLDVSSVAQLYARDHLGKPSASLTRVLEEVLAEAHVPYLSALRYRASGMRKRSGWERVWGQQREEDCAGSRLDIPIPPKYTSVDFSKQSYWRNRGKLDVPKERFISYLGAAPDGDPTMLLGWAGWNHLEQAHALTLLLTERISQAGWTREQLIPLLAGLREQMPWVRQWHDSEDPVWGGSPAEQLGAYLRQQQQDYELSDEALEGWRP